jgi:hypothetical protein
MEILEIVAARIEYRCVLVLPHSLDVLAFPVAGHHRLPRIHIAPRSRPAQEIKMKVKAKWGLDVFVLEHWEAADDYAACAVAEVEIPKANSPLKLTPTSLLMHCELSEHEYLRVRLIIEGRTSSPVSHLGWTDQAIAWMESATGSTFSSRADFEQWNAGGGFALLHVHSDDGLPYWLKATGEPNAHEFAMMRFLCKMCPDFLPKLVAIRKEWNAWLTEDAGDPLSDAPGPTELATVATRMARLQLLAIDWTDELLASGAFDQRLPALRSHIDAVIAFLIEAMGRQTSTRVAPLSRDRLLELGEILRDACFRLEAHDVPDTLIHNDLNAGNILSDGTKYVFTDWSEAAIGNAFLSCERLCQLNRAHADIVRNIYRDTWSPRLSTESMDEVLALTPFIAIYAHLYGRGHWLGQAGNLLPHFESYARSLARHMDRAAKDSHLLEILCH